MQTCFRLGQDRPHTLAGLQTRLVAKSVLHNFCVWLNRQSGRPNLILRRSAGLVALFHTKRLNTKASTRAWSMATKRCSLLIQVRVLSKRDLTLGASQPWCFLRFL